MTGGVLGGGLLVPGQVCPTGTAIGGGLFGGLPSGEFPGGGGSRGCDKVQRSLSKVRLFYHWGSVCGIPPSLTTPCYLYGLSGSVREIRWLALLYP